MKVIITGDHAGMTLRNEVKSVLNELGFTYEDTGADCKSSVDYPDYALPAAKQWQVESLTEGFLFVELG